MLVTNAESSTAPGMLAVVKYATLESVVAHTKTNTVIALQARFVLITS